MNAFMPIQAIKLVQAHAIITKTHSRPIHTCTRKGPGCTSRSTKGEGETVVDTWLITVGKSPPIHNHMMKDGKKTWNTQ